MNEGSPLAKALMRHVLVGPPLRLATRMRVEGRQHVPPTGPLIVASNHLSFVDSMVIPLASKRTVHFLGKSEYFEGTGLKGRFVAAFHQPGGRSRSTEATPAPQRSRCGSPRTSSGAAAPSGSTQRAPVPRMAGCTAGVPAWRAWP